MNRKTKTKKQFSVKGLVIATIVTSLLMIISFCLIYWNTPSPDTSAIKDCGGGYSKSADGLVVVNEIDARCMVNDADLSSKKTLNLIGVSIASISTVLNFLLLSLILKKSW